MLASQPSPVRLQDSSKTNTRLFSGNQALDSGAVGFGLGVGAAVLGSSLLNNQNNNPCGKRRRRRDAQDTRFFLGSNNNCNYPSSNTQYHPSNNYGSSSNTYYPSNNHVSSSNTYPSNNYVSSSNSYPSNNYVSSSNSYPSNNYVSSSNSYPSNNYGSSCQCTQLSFTDHQGNVNGKCQSYDSGKGAWCYTTGWNSGCTDLHKSQKFPNNPWSYQACSLQRNNNNLG